MNTLPPTLNIEQTETTATLNDGKTWQEDGTTIKVECAENSVVTVTIQFFGEPPVWFMRVLRLVQKDGREEEVAWLSALVAVIRNLLHKNAA